MENETDLVAPQGAQVADFPAIVVDHFITQRHAPGGRINHCAQTFEQRALAGPGRANQANHLAGCHLHVHAFQGIDRGIPLAITFSQTFDANAFATHLNLQWLRPDRP